MTVIEAINCPACKPFADCLAPMLIGFLGGVIQIIRSKNYSFKIFVAGVFSSIFVALIICLVGKDTTWFENKQGILLSICGISGTASNWICDVVFPKFLKKIFDRAGKEIDK